MGDLGNVLLQLLLLPIGLLVGGAVERKHLRDLDRREEQVRHIRVNNLKRVTEPGRVARAEMVRGQVVIATDYYKTFATGLRNLIGGEMKAAESLMTRGRREALLRALEAAAALGATELWNVRFGYCNIGLLSDRNSAMQVEVIAWGTAIVRA